MAPVLVGQPQQFNNDWKCPTCEENNFARRTQCFRCKKAKPGGGMTSAAPSSATAQRDQSPARVERTHDFKTGDWSCTSCQSHNFARRQTCFRCDARRSDAEAGEEGAFRGYKHKKADWTCSECNKENFARRTDCFRCGTARPPSRHYWLCPNPDCGFSNLGVRRSCMKCDTASPHDPLEYARPGDWRCTCGYLNFGSRSACQQCEAEKNDDCEVKEFVPQQLSLDLGGDEEE